VVFFLNREMSALSPAIAARASAVFHRDEKLNFSNFSNISRQVGPDARRDQRCEPSFWIRLFIRFHQHSPNRGEIR
jgi:hypothetical protein